MIVPLAGLVDRRRMPAPIGGKVRMSVGGDAVRTAVACNTWHGWLDCLAVDDRRQHLVRGGSLVVARRFGAVRAWLVNPTAEDIAWLTAHQFDVA